MLNASVPLLAVLLAAISLAPNRPCYAQWTTPELVWVDTSGIGGDPALAVEGEKVVAFLTRSRLDGFVFGDEILLVRRVEGAWTTPANVSNTSGSSENPVATYLEGTFYGVWKEQGESPVRDNFADIVYVSGSGDTLREQQKIVSLSPSEAPPPELPFIRQANPMQFVRGPSETLHLSFALLDVDGSFITHQRYDPTGWTTYQKVAHGYYPHLEAGPGDVLYLAFLSTEPALGDGPALITSPDGGRTWTEPVLIYARPAPDNGLFSPYVIPAPDGRLHALWRQSTNRDLQGRFIQHAISEDGGRTWSQPETLRPPDGGVILNIEPVAGPQGRLHLFYHWRPWALDPVGRIYHRVLQESGWTEPTKLFGTDRVRWSYRTPALSVTPQGHLHALWMETWSGTARAYYATVDLASLGTAEPPGTDEAASPRNYPNPFGHTTTLTFTLEAAGSVRLRLYTLSGRFVEEHDLGRRTAGPQSFVLNGSGLASGTYFYEIQAGAEVKYGGLTIVR